MKRSLLLLSLISQIAFVSAQSIVVTGDSIFYGDAEVDIASYLTVKNTSAADIDVICEKNVISQPQGSSNHFCWGGTCYGSATIISPDFTTIDAGQSSTEFSGHFTGPPNSTATVEYCFYEDPLFATCLTVIYDGNGATIIKENISHVISDFFPNPANDFIKFNYYLNDNASLIIMDILGNKVKQVALQEKGEKNIDISDLSKGIYFGNLMSNNEIIAIKKLIIK